MKIRFLHGWYSIPGGVKPTYLAQHGHEVSNPALPDEDFAEAVRVAQAEFNQHQPAVVVGSSRGGAVAMNITSGAATVKQLRSNLSALQVEWDHGVDDELRSLAEVPEAYWARRGKLQWN